MLRRVVARQVLALCAALTVLSAPATAVLHGLAHERESAALVSHMDATGDRNGHAGRAVEAADADESHPALHAGLAIQKSGELATAMPSSQSAGVTRPPCEFEARVPSVAVVVPGSPHGDPAAQPRAPPLA